jgi:hypothetical protein
MHARRTDGRLSRRACLGALVAAGCCPGAVLASAALPWSRAWVLDYEVSGRARGVPYRASSQLRWEARDSAYTAVLEMRAPLVGTRTQRSEGRIDDRGTLRPDRFTDQARREHRYELEWARQRYRYVREGEPLREGALPAGTQDRLSLFFQLGGWAAAQAPRGEASVELPVLGRGGAEPWAFRLTGREAVDTPAGALDAWRLERQIRAPDDTAITLWLAPALQYLPARLLLEDDEGHRVDQRLRRLPAGRD